MSYLDPNHVETIDIIGGVPLSGSQFFVNSVTGLDTNTGRSWSEAVATIDYAIGLTTADNGDVIFVAAEHAESITAAAGIVCDVAGIRIVGLGIGKLRPTITFTTVDTADIDIDAANVAIKNIRFISGVAALAAPIDVNAAGFVMEECDFYVAAAANHPLICVLTDAAANHIRISRCSFNLEYDIAATALIVTTARTAAIRLVGADFAIVEDCYVSGNFTAAAIDSLTTACRDVRILRNFIRNVQTTNIAGIIDLVAATTGVVAQNQGFHGYATDIATAIDPASCGMVANYISNVVTETGGLVGTAST